jgi:hypothetical protein
MPEGLEIPTNQPGEPAPLSLVSDVPIMPYEISDLMETPSLKVVGASGEISPLSAATRRSTAERRGLHPDAGEIGQAFAATALSRMERSEIRGQTLRIQIDR